MTTQLDRAIEAAARAICHVEAGPNGCVMDTDPDRPWCNPANCVEVIKARAAVRAFLEEMRDVAPATVTAMLEEMK